MFYIKQKFKEGVLGKSVELKNDLNNFNPYGIGDWQLFRNEFNEDFSFHITDIDRLATYYESMKLIAVK